jgi:hypothetical protein
MPSLIILALAAVLVDNGRKSAFEGVTGWLKLPHDNYH